MDNVSVDAPVAAVRMLGTAEPEKKDWTSHEFISLVGTVAVNLITAATVVGWVDASQAQELTKAVTAIIAGATAISVNGIAVWKYINGKQQVEAQKIQAQYRYAETVEQSRMLSRQYGDSVAAAKPNRRK